VNGLKGEMPKTRQQRRRGVDSGEGCPHPQPNTESGKRHELPSMVRAENEFRYYTASNYDYLHVLHWKAQQEG